MVTLDFRRFSALFLGITAASSIAVAQVSEVSATTPSITSVSMITTAKHQTITITGKGFGTHKAYTGDSPYISLYDQNKKWEAGYKPDGDTVTLIVNSWTNTKITLGGFAGKWGTSNFTLAVGNKEKIRIFNAQGRAVPLASPAPPVVLPKRLPSLLHSLELKSALLPNPSISGAPVTLTAVVTSGGGVPPDGGKVLFMTDRMILGSGTMHGGVARLTTSRLEFGRNAIRAEYAGDADFDGTRVEDKSAVATHTVN